MNKPRYKKIVVKIGSTLITDGGKGIDRKMIATWAEQMAALRTQGIDVVLVSSGSIAEGITRLGLKARPTNLSPSYTCVSIVISLRLGRFSPCDCFKVNIIGQAVLVNQ